MTQDEMVEQAAVAVECERQRVLLYTAAGEALNTASKEISAECQLHLAAAAKVLGVSVSTLRNWDRTGKLKPHRHPLNGYRLYDERVVRTLRQQIDEGTR